MSRVIPYGYLQPPRHPQQLFDPLFGPRTDPLTLILSVPLVYNPVSLTPSSQPLNVPFFLLGPLSFRSPNYFLFLFPNYILSSHPCPEDPTTNGTVTNLNHDKGNTGRARPRRDPDPQGVEWHFGKSLRLFSSDSVKTGRKGWGRPTSLGPPYFLDGLAGQEGEKRRFREVVGGGYMDRF